MLYFWSCQKQDFSKNENGERNLEGEKNERKMFSDYFLFHEASYQQCVLNQLSPNIKEGVGLWRTFIRNILID